MTSRLGFYALSARNTIGRAVGADWSYTPAQVAVAQEIYGTWMSFLGIRPVVAVAWVADADREVSLTPKLEGDARTGGALGICQWHATRRAIIKQGTGIDVTTASVKDQCRAAYWECSKEYGYKQVLPLLAAAQTDEEINAIIIADFERSANHEKDLARQLPMARYWLGRLGPQPAPTS